MTITRSTIPLAHEGAALEAQLLAPAGSGPHPAVMVMHNAHGLGEHMIEVSEALAQQGYAALATDMYGGGSYHADRPAAGAAIMPLWSNPALLRSRILAWFERLRGLPQIDARRIAAIGYCFGGQCVLELARSGADVQAVVSYHGILKTQSPAQAGQVKAHVSVYTGSLDPYAPHEDVAAFRAEMVAAGAHWQLVEFSNTYHSFTDHRLGTEPDDGKAYDALAAKLSWAGTLEILDSYLHARA